MLTFDRPPSLPLPLRGSLAPPGYAHARSLELATAQGWDLDANALEYPCRCTARHRPRHWTRTHALFFFLSFPSFLFPSFRLGSVTFGFLFLSFFFFFLFSLRFSWAVGGASPFGLPFGPMVPNSIIPLTNIPGSKALNFLVTNKLYVYLRSFVREDRIPIPRN